MNSRLKVLIAYVAAPHGGYLKLFRAHRGISLYILGREFTNEFPSLVRHLPGVEPEEARKMIHTLGIFADVHILTAENIENVRGMEIIMPDEDVSHGFAKKHLCGIPVTYDGAWRLRWDWGSVNVSHHPEGEGVASVDQVHRDLMSRALQEAKRSPDWWRQIGALLVRDGEPLLVSFNQHVPSEQSAYIYGDPRSNFDAGQRIEVSSAIHAENALIATAARKGISMEGCDLYVSTFPCPPCAHSCSFTGIKRLYYASGYSLLDGAGTLQSKGVEIIRVQM